MGDKKRFRYGNTRPQRRRKDTLLHVILGWNKPDSGTVELGGKSIGSYSRREMGKLISLVPQYEHISFEYSLVEYVLLGRTPHLPTLQSPSPEDCRIAVDALKTVGLDKIAGKSVARLRRRREAVGSCCQIHCSEPLYPFDGRTNEQS